MSDFYEPNPNKDYLLVSVQHTGTRFTQRILTAAGILTAQIHPVATRKKQIDPWIEQNEMADGVPIIVPLRNPYSVAQSWIQRAQKHSTHEPDSQIQVMFDQWAYLAEIIKVSKPLFLPVDHPERELYLDEMGDAIGAKLETDWHKYGSNPNSADVKLDQPTVNKLNEMIATSFLQDFYAEVPCGTFFSI